MALFDSERLVKLWKQSEVLQCLPGKGIVPRVPNLQLSWYHTDVSVKLRPTLYLMPKSLIFIIAYRQARPYRQPTGNVRLKPGLH